MVCVHISIWLVSSSLAISASQKYLSYLPIIFALKLLVAVIECAGLPSAESIGNFTLTYQDTLSLQYSQDRLFPSLTFTFDGRIVGWTFAATDNRGGGRPQIGVWSLDSNTGSYSVRGREILDECVSSEVKLDTNITVSIHNGGPPRPGLPFNRGDILGVFMRPSGIADFVPYLYNGSLQSDVGPFGGYFSYFLSRRTPRSAESGILSDININRDLLLPLMSLKLCKVSNLAGWWNFIVDCPLPAVGMAD